MIRTKWLKPKQNDTTVDRLSNVTLQTVAYQGKWTQAQVSPPSHPQAQSILTKVTPQANTNDELVAMLKSDPYLQGAEFIFDMTTGVMSIHKNGGTVRIAKDLIDVVQAGTSTERQDFVKMVADKLRMQAAPTL